MNNPVEMFVSRYYYTAYGLSIAVNRPLPVLSLSMTEVEQVDVEVHFAERQRLPDHFKSFRRGAWTPLSVPTPRQHSKLKLFSSLDEPLISLLLPMGVEFVFSEDARHIWVNWNALITFEYTAALLLNMGLAYNLHLRHFTCLHGSAVEVNGQAVIFVGDSGMGKSTTASYFAQRGHPVITDDIAALQDQNGSFSITPGYPSLRLLDSSITSDLLQSQPTLTPIAPDLDKQYLSLGDKRFQFAAAPLPISQIFLIVDWANEVVIEPIPPSEAAIWLNRYNYLYHLSEMDAHSRNFAFLARLASVVRVSRLKIPDQIAHLSQLYDIVLHSSHGSSLSSRQMDA